jgi:aminopeptidase N
MRIITLIFLLSSSFVSFAQPARNFAQIDVQHYNISISLSDDNDSIHCKEIVSFKLMQDATSVDLDLISVGSNGKGMKVEGVWSGDSKLNFTHEKDILRIDLPEKKSAISEYAITVSYSGIPANGLIISKSRFNHRTFFGDNWPNRAHNSIVCNDHPSDKASVEFTVEAPTHYQVVANGVQVEETIFPANRRLTKYVENVPLPTKVMAIGLADFAVNDIGEVQCIPVTSWVFSEDRNNGPSDYGSAKNILAYFIEKIGPYGYRKLANVQSKTMFGGMENASAIFYSETSVTGKGHIDDLLAHEIAHQWFGNMATEKNWSDVWLSEGFATYMTQHYIEHVYGRDSMNQRMEDDRRQVIDFSKKNSLPVVDTITTNYMELLNVNSYQKGSWVLHMLRNKLGDNDFWKGMRAYYAQYAGKNASTDDFRKAMETATGKNLEAFFNQWLRRPGQPNLDIAWRYDQQKKQVEVKITQQQSQLFSFPIDIFVRANDGSRQAKLVNVTEKTTTILVPSTQVPAYVIADPDIKLLYEGKVHEVKE